MVTATIVATIVLSKLTIGLSYRLPIRFKRQRGIEADAREAVHERPLERETPTYGAGPFHAPA